MIVVDNVPRVEPDKLEKLQSVINKVLGKFGTIVNQHYPMNENDGKTKGLVQIGQNWKKKLQKKAALFLKYFMIIISFFSLTDTFFWNTTIIWMLYRRSNLPTITRSTNRIHLRSIFSRTSKNMRISLKTGNHRKLSPLSLPATCTTICWNRMLTINFVFFVAMGRVYRCKSGKTLHQSLLYLKNAMWVVLFLRERKNVK